MKTKRTLIFILVVMILLVFGGCNNKSQNVISKESNSLKTEEITSETELEKLWEEYLYYAITTVGNNKGFNSPKEIDPVNIARYCWRQYMKEHGSENKLESFDKNSSSKIFPVDTVLKYLSKYFNLNNLDLSKVSNDLYDGKRYGFILHEASEEKIPSYTDKNSFGIQLGKVTKNDDTITAVMIQYDSYTTKRIETKSTYRLKKRQDGSMYFLSCSFEYVNNHLVTLNGDYKHFDSISGFNGEMSQLSMIGEVDGRMILVYNPGEKNRTASVMCANPNTLTIEKKLDLDKDFSGCHFKMMDDNIFAYLNDKVVVINKNLKQIDSIKIPETISNKIKRKIVYDSNGFPNIQFGGYDMSRDRSKFVYSDEDGVKLFDVKNNSEKLISKTIVLDNQNTGMKNAYHLNPRFVSNDKKIITSIQGYEAILDCNICDIEKNTSKKIGIPADIYTGAIYYDTGVLGVNTFIYDDKHNEKIKTLYYNFNTCATTEIKLEDTGETGDMRNIDQCYVGSNYAAFVTRKYDRNDYANNMTYINRLNIKTFKLEPKLLSIKAADAHILGVLKDGRIIFWYDYYPCEKGVCITK